MNRNRVTRGYGLLEGLLASQRARVARRLVAQRQDGSVLDIGCGSYPLFLERSGFAEKVGLEQAIGESDREELSRRGITIISRDIQKDRLGFEEHRFDAITMLAVFEHIGLERLPAVLAEVHQSLKAGGVFVLTTPTPLGDRILHVMARLWLVSREEIIEHQHACSGFEIAELLQQAGFGLPNIRMGRFEFGLNRWVQAVK